MNLGIYDFNSVDLPNDKCNTINELLLLVIFFIENNFMLYIWCERYKMNSKRLFSLKKKMHLDIDMHLKRLF